MGNHQSSDPSNLGAVRPHATELLSMPTFPQIMRLPNDKQNAIDKEVEIDPFTGLINADWADLILDT